MVAKIEADAQAIMWLAFSASADALEISDYADRYIADRLKTLPGVATVIIGGERRYAMRIWLDRDRLAAFGLTPQDVENALRRQNVEMPGRAHREHAARVHRARRDRPAHRRGVQQHDRQRGAAAIRCACETSAAPSCRRRGRAQRSCASTATRPWAWASSSSPPPTRSVAQAVRRVAAEDPSGAARGHEVEVAFDSSIFIDEVDRGGVQDDGRGGACWWCW